MAASSSRLIRCKFFFASLFSLQFSNNPFCSCVGLKANSYIKELNMYLHLPRLYMSVYLLVIFLVLKL